jgi:putative peptide zinc metalloprotease protein
VGALIRTKLQPNGIVAGGNGALLAAGRQASPLGLQLRVALIGPRAIAPFSWLAQVLFFPGVVVVALVASAAARLWLYGVHGMGHALESVIYEPWRLGVLVAIAVASAGFHELGHATALRVAGGQARGMGIGFYLIYPVFFTDTTDAYRLGRWGRVRVDLGGFYFQLIAAVALMGVALALDVEWLFLPVLFINAEALRQLLFPFVRLDGYWLFADLTGVPDFFSHARPFVKSLLPGALRKPGGLPALKRSTKAVFATYLIAAVPILGFLFFQIAMNMPHFISIAWHSFAAQKGSLAQAMASGDIAQAAGSLGQMLILALPAIGSAVMYLIITAWLASTVWRRRLATRRAQ